MDSNFYQQLKDSNKSYQLGMYWYKVGYLFEDRTNCVRWLSMQNIPNSNWHSRILETTDGKFVVLYKSTILLGDVSNA